jgi:hypothetical protein
MGAHVSGHERPCLPLMSLPNADQVLVPRRKLTGYLLSDTHPCGRGKAQYLRSHGFTADRVDLLEEALCSIAMTGDLVATERTAYGTMYVVVGVSMTPTGRMIQLRTVWIVEPVDRRPRFVAAYPAR